jgi:DNA repair protein RadA/Sms
MAKNKTVYVCQHCGAEASKWIGKCPSCGSWNTYVEEIIARDTAVSLFSATGNDKAKPVSLSRVESSDEQRVDTCIGELNRILGGGIVKGSLVLLGGEPGIGKSTLALQMALKCKEDTLYISGEESTRQIKMRAERVGREGEDCKVLADTSLENILAHLKHEKPGMVVIDSIQTLHYSAVESSPGSVSQVRECAANLLRYAKETSTPVILIGHITKDGSLAGPKVLEHIVDVVLQFEGDSHHMYRLLRAHKNRFGSTSEIGIFEMNSEGLTEVGNPSDVLLNHHEEPMSGIAVASTIDGIRPFLVEIQALVSTAAYGMPQRSVNGFDTRRLNMLLAVLEKRAGFKLTAKDVFVNVAGGFRVDDPAIDMALVSAVLSSSLDIAINPGYCFSGEIGLSGEIRPVGRIEQRVMEAQKMGFTRLYLSGYSRKSIPPGKFPIELTFVSRVEELFKSLFKE